MTSPFKDIELLEKEVTDFINKYKVTVVSHSKRISNFFEMSCFNYIVRFYELQGYNVIIKSLQSGQYRYKCSTSGIQSNFSHFEVDIQFEGECYKFEIHHNLAVQSSHDSSIFTTPDICVIKTATLKSTIDYYDAKTTFSFVNNVDLITFCEVKHFTPYPELLFNFMGVINELKKEYIINQGLSQKTNHIAPSLMISGKPNKQTLRIKKSLESRYCINIIYDLFYTGTITFSNYYLNQLRITGKNPCN